MEEMAKKTKRILLTSAKGGVGVGFVTVNLALALCRRGCHVLLVDANPVCRTLDTILGCEGDVIYDISDLAAHRVDIDTALLSPLGEGGPQLLPGAFSSEAAVGGRKLTAVLGELAATEHFDFILVDAPALPETVATATAYDRICVPTDPSALSLRAAEGCGVAFTSAGAREVMLVINRFSLLPPRESGQDKAILMLDAARLPLLAIIPIVGELTETAHRYVGKYPRLDGRAFRGEAAKIAFDHMAGRLLGLEIPLLSDIRAVRSYRRKLLY